MRSIAVLVLLAGLQDPVGPPPASLGLAAFYKKHVDAGGIPVVGSEKVSDAALIDSKALILAMI